MEIVNVETEGGDPRSPRTRGAIPNKTLLCWFRWEIWGRTMNWVGGGDEHNTCLIEWHLKRMSFQARKQRISNHPGWWFKTPPSPAFADSSIIRYLYPPNTSTTSLRRKISSIEPRTTNNVLSLQGVEGCIRCHVVGQEVFRDCGCSTQSDAIYRGHEVCVLLHDRGDFWA